VAEIRRRLVAFSLVLGILTLVWLPAVVHAQSNAEYFQQVISGQVEAPALAGPISGALVQQTDILSVNRAGVDVGDFVAHAAFVNPAITDGVGWDYGFQFRTTGNNDDFRIFVTSEGTWNFSVGVESPQQTVVAPSLDVADGAVNTLDLIVQGSEALFGINGEFVGTINLPELAPSGDVFASTGFLADLVVPDRVVEVSDFMVYEFPGEGSESEEQVAVAEPTPPARPVTLVTGSCAAPGEPLQGLLEATYPIGERQGSVDGQVAQTSFTRVPYLIGDLLAAPHAIVVSQSFDAPDVTVGCADLGGIPDEIGGFVLGLSPVGDTGIAGIIYVAGEDDLGRTNISVFLAPEAGATVEAVEEATDAIEPAAEDAVIVVEEPADAAADGTPVAVITIEEEPAAVAGEATPTP